jgi:CBS domain containing-hemolysin-like protein
VNGIAGIGLTFVLVLANAFFVCAEFALISARRSAIEPRARAGSRAAKVTLGAMENVSLMMAGAQLGITLSSIVLGAVSEPAIAHLLEDPFHAVGMPVALLHPLAFAVALSIVVLLHVVIGEMVPKNIALAGPERAAIVLGPPLVAVVRVLEPVIVVMNAVANVSLRALRVEPKDEVASAFTREEVAGLVEESRREGLLDADEHELLSGALSFDERTAADVLIPFADLVVVAGGVTPAEIERLAVDTGFTRFPVTGEAGGLTGYLHLKDVLETRPDRREAPVAAKWVRPLVHVRAGDPLRQVLETMQRTGSHLARVTDAFGAVLGLVALEDVLEEIVGEIRDEVTARTRITDGTHVHQP